MVGFIVFLVLVAYPVFLLICTIASGGGADSFTGNDLDDSYDDNFHFGNTSVNSGADRTESWDGYEYSKDNCCCESDDCYDNDDCDCEEW